MKKKELKTKIKQLYAEIHTLVFEPESEHAQTVRILCQFRDKQEKARANMKGEMRKGADELIDMQRKINRAAVINDTLQEKIDKARMPTSEELKKQGYLGKINESDTFEGLDSDK